MISITSLRLTIARTANQPGSSSLFTVGDSNPGVIFSAAYALYLYRRMMYGPLEKPSLRAISDLGYREILVFAPLVLLVVFFGFYPAPLLDVTAVAVKKLVSNYEAALKAQEAANVR